jgi:TRAP-type C4-dicarboxylate transport system permease small subunit
MKSENLLYSFNLLNKLVNKIEMFLSISMLAIMIIINVMEIITRFTTGHSFVWVYPTTLLLLSWVVFITTAVVFYQKEYIVVEYFVNLLPPKYQRYVNIMINLIIIIFFVFLLYMAPSLIQMQAQKMQVLTLPRYFLSLPLFIGSISVIFFTSYDTIKLIFKDVGVEGE